jgi:hypothetical protein
MAKASKAPTDKRTGQITGSEGKAEAEVPPKETDTRNSYKNSKKVEFINAYKIALGNSKDKKVSFRYVAGQMSLDVHKSTLRSWWVHRDTLCASVKQVPGNGDLTRVYPRRLEIVEEALYRAIKEEVAKGI